MKKIFLIIILSLGAIYLFTKKATPNYLDLHSKVLEEIPKEKEHEILKIIKKINENNLKINNLFVENVSIKLKQKISLNVSGTMAFQRNKNFRMNIFSNFGKELDIGSNDSHFWFWSKGMNPPTLYYANHDNLKRTLLKNPLNPNWLLESLTLMELNTENIEIGKFKNLWVILQKRKGISNENMTIATLIDPINERITGNYLYNSDGKMVASSEILGFYDKIPKRIFIIWYEEGITMEWTLNNPQINSKINSNLFLIPNIYPKINMGDNSQTDKKYK